MVSLLKLFNDFSYKEKSILISLLAVAGLYGNYFYDLLSGAVEENMAAMLTNMAVLVCALIVVHIVFHIVISLDDVDEAEDERDKAVARRASVFGYNVLLVAVLAVIGRIVILGAMQDGGPLEGRLEGADLVPPGSFEIANLLLAGLILSEVVYYAAQLFFYRRGVQG